MPISGLLCRSCLKVTDYSAQHWLSECSEPTLDPGLLQAAIDRQKKGEARAQKFRSEHPGLWFGVSTALGGVREAFLRKHTIYYPEAQGFMTSEMGDAIGARCEEGLLSLGWETQTLVFGQWQEWNLFGYIDARTEDWTTIRDTKVKGQGAFHFQTSRGYLASIEDSAQVSLYAKLAASMGHKIALRANLEIWYGAMVPAVDYKTNKMLDSWMKARGQHLGDEDLLNLHAFGQGITVRETLDVLTMAEKRLEGGEKFESVANFVPPACADMFGKKKCAYYCGSLYSCFDLRGEDVRKLGKPRVRFE